MKAGWLQNTETHMTPFRLIHEDTKVAVWVHNKKLPEWGLGHLEVNGNKNAVEKTNYWVALCKHCNN